MKNKFLLFFVIVALLSSLFIGMVGCSPDAPQSDGGDETEKTEKSVLIDENFALSNFNNNISTVEAGDGIKVTFDASIPHPSEVTWGMSSATITVNTQVFPYVIIKYSRIDFLSNVKMVVGATEHSLLPTDVSEAKTYTVDLRTIGENNVFISDKLNAQLRLAVLSGSTNTDASAIFDYILFSKTPLIDESFNTTDGWTLQNAEADYTDGYMKLSKTGGDKASLSKKIYCDFENLNTISAAIQDFEGNYTFSIKGEDKSAVLLDNVSQKGGFVFNANDYGLTKSGEYEISFTFDNQFSITSFTLNRNTINTIEQFDEKNISVIDDNDSARIDPVEGAARIAIPEDTFVTITNSYNVNASPVLNLKIGAVSEGASYKIELFHANVTYSVVSLTDKPNEFRVNLNDFGLRGEIGYDIRICIYGAIGSYVDLAYMKVSNEDVKPMQNRIREDFTHSGQAIGWTLSGAETAEIKDNALYVYNKQDLLETYSVITKFYTVDLEKYPLFKFNIVETTGSWKVEVFNAQDVLLQGWNNSVPESKEIDLTTLFQNTESNLVKVKVNIYMEGKLDSYCKITQFESVSK